MAERARELADRFARANTEFAAFIERVPDEHWSKPVSAGDPRPVGVVARHVAWAYGFEHGYFQAMAEGRPLPPVTEVDTLNAEFARQWQDVSREEVLAELCRHGEMVTGWIAGLSDDQLGRSGQYVVGGSHRTVEQWIERVLLGHIAAHLSDLRADSQA